MDDLGKHHILEVPYKSTVDYTQLSTVKRNAPTIETPQQIDFPYIAGTVAISYTDEVSPSTALLFGNQTSINTLQHFKEWPSQINVDNNKSWEITFAHPFEIETISNEHIYVLDNRGNMIPQIFSYGSNDSQSILQISPSQHYEAGETYTLIIEEVWGRSGEKLNECIKMNFTVKA